MEFESNLLVKRKWTFLLVVLAFSLQTGDAFSWTEKPNNPTQAKEGKDIPLKWNYSLDADETFNKMEFLCSVGTTIVLRDSANGKPILNPAFPSSSRFNITEKATLFITKVNRTDAGRYSCKLKTSKDRFGTASGTQLDVQYSPENTYLSTSANVSATLKNSTVDFRCTADGNPAPKYKLYYNSTYLGNSNSGTFQIQVTESGHYVCIPYNIVGNESVASVYVNVVDPATADVSSSPDHVVEGHNVTLHCRVTGSPPLSIKWTKVNESNVLSNSSKLTLYNVTRPDEVLQYQCTAKNGYGDPASDVVIIKVYYKPKILSMNDTEVHENSSVHFVADVEGNPEPYVAWISPDGSVISNKTGGLNYNKTSITRDEQGRYECRVTNIVGTDQRNFTVTVLYPAQVVKPAGNISITPVERSDVDLVCTAEGNPTPHVTWFFPNGTRLKNGTTSVNFTLTSVSRDDNETYQCEARNKFGSDVATIKLDVLYPPKIISVLHNNASVTGKTIVVRENDDVHLEAVVEGNPVPSVAWISPKTILSNSTKRDFTITKIKRDETGAYKCEISNGIPKGTSAEFKINVEFAPCKCNNGGTCNEDKTCKCPLYREGKYCDGLSLAFIIIIEAAANVAIAVIVLCCWCKKRRKCPTSSVHEVVTEEETLRGGTNGNGVLLAMQNMGYANEGPSARDGSGYVQVENGPAPGAAEGNYAEIGKAGAAGGVPLVTYASVDQSKKKKKKKTKGEKLEEDDMQGTATYAQVDKSKKKKKRKEGELFYADLSEFSGQRGGLTFVQVSPPPTLGPVKVSPEYESTDYVDISQFSSKKKEDKPVVGEEGKPEQQKPAADAAGPDGRIVVKEQEGSKDEQG